MDNRMRIGLFDPGMTHLHRVGLAGLYMTLKCFAQSGQSFPGLSWVLSEHYIELFWEAEPKGWLQPLLEKSFGFDKDGLIDFAAHRRGLMGDLERITLHEAVLGTFLQHPRVNKMRKTDPRRSVTREIGDKTVAKEYRPFLRPYAHVEAAEDLLKGAQFADAVGIKGWWFPGAAERHEGLRGTNVEEPVKRALCLLFAPVGSLFYRLYHRGLDGKTDKRRGYAVVFPHITGLSEYCRCFVGYLNASIEDLSADGLGEASLSALLTLKAQGALEDLGVTGSTAITMGTVSWSSQQRTRTLVATIARVSSEQLTLFDIARRTIPNKVVVSEPKPTNKDPRPKAGYYVTTSQCRGLFAENIALGRDWFSGFTGLMLSKNLYRVVSYEKGGLSRMIDEMKWPHEADKKLVQAVHIAIRNRLGAVAAQANQKGEKVPFDREFERMRTGLMRAKNSETLRGELADLFARGRPNAALQESWEELLPALAGPNWHRTRDLALLALASYKGKEVATEEQIDEEMEEML